MKKHLLISGMALLLSGSSCTNQENDETVTANAKKADISNGHETAAATPEQKNKPSDFLPEGYKLSEVVRGDLNKDAIEDCVLLIKGTNPAEIVTDENRGKQDLNRRGIVILFGRDNGYILAAKNYNCFSSENEDGGVYYPPELSVEVKKGNLVIQYSHGRYGYWYYTFRYAKSDFELIGYDASSNYGPVVKYTTSINFLTQKMLRQDNVNENDDGGEEVFKETWKKISVKELKRLSEIKDFDKMDISY